MDFGLILLTFVLAMVGTLALGLVFKWVDRKVTAMVQYRVGPPWYQPFADFFKLMGKVAIFLRGLMMLFSLTPYLAMLLSQLPWSRK